MKALLLAILCTASGSLFAQDSSYSVLCSKAAEHTSGVELSAHFNAAAHSIDLQSTAPVNRLLLSVYTPEQLSVRKGTDYPYSFEEPLHNYTLVLDDAARKDQYAYWIKLYADNDMIGECYLQQKKRPMPVKPTIDNDDPGAETKNKDGVTIIRTNIHCVAGSKNVQETLKNMDGVTNVSINIKTGVLLITYSSDGTPFRDIIAAIRKNGFSANGKPAETGAANPCIPKTK